MGKLAFLHLIHLILVVFFWQTEIRAAEYHLVTLEYPPLEFKDSSGEAKGAAVEVVTRIMTQLGHSVSIEVLPWTRALKMVKHGRADAIFTIFKNAERELFLDYSGEVLIPQMVAFYARKDSQITYRGQLEELKHFKIGVVSTISYGRKFDSARPGLKIERTATLEQNFTKMLLGRIDLVINNVYSARIAVEKLHIADKIKRLRPSVENVPSYIAFSKMKNLTRLQQVFDRKLIALKASGEFDEIIRKSSLILEKNDVE